MCVCVSSGKHRQNHVYYNFVCKYSKSHRHVQFCVLWHAQVQAEVQGFLKMLDEVYGTFGLDYSIALSTRPESYLVRK